MNSEKKPTILAIFDTSNMNGVTYWRYFVPLNNLIQRGIQVANTNRYNFDWGPGLLDGYDAIFFNRFLADISHKDMFDNAERDGIKVIVDLDDYYVLPDYHPNVNTYRHRYPIILENLIRADLVTVSTPYLAAKIKDDIGVDAVVLRNAVDFSDPQFTVNRTVSNRMRFGWCGGSTHENDLKLLQHDLSVLHSQSAYRDKYRMVLQGYVNNDYFWRKASEIFSDFNKADVECLSVINAAPVWQYAQGYNYYDVALAPLVDGEFERCKSELKCIEAASFGLPIIVSDVEPYRQAKELLGDAVILVRNKKGSFLKAMQHLINNPEEVKERGRIGFEAVRKHYNVNNVNEDRYNAIMKCLNLPTS